MKIEVYKDPKKQWRWRLTADNGEPLCSPNDSFASKRALRHNLFLVFRDCKIETEDVAKIAPYCGNFPPIIKVTWPAKPSRKPKTK